MWGCFVCFVCWVCCFVVCVCGVFWVGFMCVVVGSFFFFFCFSFGVVVVVVGGVRGG